MPGTRSDEFTHDICFCLSLTPFLRIDQIMTTWITLLFRKSPLYPFTALASGTTALSIRLNVIRGPFHYYVDGRNGQGGKLIGSGEGAQGEKTDTKADFVFLVADSFGRFRACAGCIFSYSPHAVSLHFCEIQVLGGIRRFLFFSTCLPVSRWESHYLRTPFSSGNSRSWPSVFRNVLTPRELWRRVALIVNILLGF